MGITKREKCLVISIRRCLALLCPSISFSCHVVRKGLLLPQILGELPDVLKTLDDENVKNVGQHDINFEASSIHTVIFFSASKN